MQKQEQEMIPEEVGKRAAFALLSQIHVGGTVDGLHQVSPEQHISHVHFLSVLLAVSRTVPSAAAISPNPPRPD